MNKLLCFTLFLQLFFKKKQNESKVFWTPFFVPFCREKKYSAKDRKNWQRLFIGSFLYPDIEFFQFSARIVFCIQIEYYSLILTNAYTISKNKGIVFDFDPVPGFRHGLYLTFENRFLSKSPRNDNPCRNPSTGSKSNTMENPSIKHENEKSEK